MMNPEISISVPSDEQELILSTLNEVPPSVLLFGLNKEQTEHWWFVKEQFSNLGKALKAYFSGESFPLKDELTDYGIELYGCLTDFYIKLYGVIQWGFEDILQHWEDNLFVSKKKYGEIFPHNSPGQTLADILKRDADSQFSQCVASRHDFKPRKIYQTYLNHQKYNAGELNKIQQQKHLNNIKDLNRGFESNSSLEYFCLVACCIAERDKKDKTLKRKLEEYGKAKDNLSKVLNRQYRDINGHGWENGVLLETEKKGGTYRKKTS